ANDVTPARPKYNVDKFTKYRRNEKYSKQRRAGHDAPLNKSRHGLRKQREQEYPHDAANKNRTGDPQVVDKPTGSLQVRLKEKQHCREEFGFENTSIGMTRDDEEPAPLGGQRTGITLVGLLIDCHDRSPSP